MREKSGKGAAANTTRTSASPGTIRKYMVHENTNESPGKATGPKSKTPDCPPKISTRRQLAEMETHIISPEIIEEAPMDLQQDRQLPTKSEMAEMFARLETSIKGEIETVREDMSHILRRVEEAETMIERQGIEIKNLKCQMEEIQREQRNLRRNLQTGRPGEPQ